jgi:hypothetical protein
MHIIFDVTGELLITFFFRFLLILPDARADALSIGALELQAFEPPPLTSPCTYVSSPSMDINPS